MLINHNNFCKINLCFFTKSFTCGMCFFFRIVCSILKLMCDLTPCCLSEFIWPFLIFEKYIFLTSDYFFSGELTISHQNSVAQCCISLLNVLYSTCWKFSSPVYSRVIRKCVWVLIFDPIHIALIFEIFGFKSDNFENW